MATPGGFTPKKISRVNKGNSLVTNYGGCGPFQMKLVVAISLTQLCAVWGMMFMAFGGYHSDWLCYSETRPDNEAGDTDPSIVIPDKPVVAATFAKENKTKLGTCDAISSCQRIEFGKESSTIVSEWDLVCDKAWIPTAIICLQMTGVFLGSYIGGFVGDRFGRKTALYGNVAIHGALNMIAIFSVSWEMFAVVRFAIGTCVGGILSCCMAYSLEFVSEWWGEILGSLPVWNLGTASFSIVVLLTKDWEYIHFSTAVLSVLVFLPVFWVPESPRWLAGHKQVKKAKSIARRIAKVNKKPPPDTTVLEIIAKEERRRSRSNSTFSQFSNDQYSFYDLFSDVRFLAVSIKMGFIWACMCLVYYVISFSVRLFTGDFYINLIIFSVAEIPGLVFVGPVSNRLGRRLSSFIYALFIALGCLSVVMVTLLASEDAKGTAITIAALLTKMHIFAAWVIISPFSAELYPSSISHVGVDYLNSCARIGGIIAPCLIPNILDFLYITFLVMGIGLLGCCLLVISLPETNGRPPQDAMKSRSHLSIIFEETEYEITIPGNGKSDFP